MTKMMVSARTGEPLTGELAAGVDALKEQLLIVFLRRLVKGKTGVLTVPVAEIDATGDAVFSMEVDPGERAFTFTLSKKQ